MGPPLPRHEGDTSYVKYELKMGKNQIYAKNRFLGLFSGAFYEITVTIGDIGVAVKLIGQFVIRWGCGYLSNSLKAMAQGFR